MRTLCLVAAMSLVLSAATVHAQSLELGFGGGPAFVEKVDGRSYTSDIDKAGLGFGLSYSINGLARLSFDNSPFSWSGRIGYLHSSGSGTLPIAGLYIQGPGSVETRVDVWTLSVGPQWEQLREVSL